MDKSINRDNYINNSSLYDLLYTQSKYKNIPWEKSGQKNLHFQPEVWSIGFSEYNIGCITNISKNIVMGDSLNGVLYHGDCVILYENYYSCNNIKKGDIVAYSFSGNDNPIIKIIKGIPGDNFKINLTKDGWKILINFKVLKNSNNKSYKFNNNDVKMLKLYANDYPIIPENTYLIMGNKEFGTLDSSRFGLVSKDDILGKVVKC